MTRQEALRRAAPVTMRQGQAQGAHCNVGRWLPFPRVSRVVLWHAPARRAVIEATRIATEAVPLDQVRGERTLPEAIRVDPSALRGLLNV
jgi:hypothetical protein